LSVTALASAGRWLIAGGAHGLARSPDGGETWQACAASGSPQPVTAIAPSPAFAKDATLLAATWGGVLRSENAGRTWKPANFGLQNFEVAALAWGNHDLVLAATGDGIYLSPNGGRAWRAADGAEGEAVAGVAILGDGAALTVLESGVLLQSLDAGETWNALASNLPQPIAPAQLFAHKGVVWLGTADAGAFSSADGERTWVRRLPDAALCFAARGSEVCIGTAEGTVYVAGEGVAPLPSPVLHDVRTLLAAPSGLYAAGLHAGMWRWQADAMRWLHMAQAPQPLLAIEATDDGALIAAGEDGLMRSTDGGDRWESCIGIGDAIPARLTFGARGVGWAAAADGARLWRTRDHGATWQPLDAPFGVLPVAMLQATAHGLLAATYDARLQRAQLWLSADEGATWQRGAEARTGWPIVAACPEPLVLTLGGQAFAHEFGGHWGQYAVGDGQSGVRRLASDGRALFALTDAGLLRSSDGGLNWAAEVDIPAGNELLDIAAHEDALYLLLTGGRVWSRSL
jgi:photosystem II stability/assembly factor-like uncharacterized protein